MHLRFIGIGSLALLSTVSIAGPERVPCPPITSLQQVAKATNFAFRRDDGSYTVRFYPFHDEYARWDVTVTKILASSINEAITLGQRILLNTSIKKNETAP